VKPDRTKDNEKIWKMIDFKKISKSRMKDSPILTRTSFFTKKASRPTACISIGKKQLQMLSVVLPSYPIYL